MQPGSLALGEERGPAGAGPEAGESGWLGGLPLDSFGTRWLRPGSALGYSSWASGRTRERPRSGAMSTAMNFGSKSFTPRPPDKGAFPLDHFGECKGFKEKFMKCLRENSFENALCRQESKEYLECRMERQVNLL
ncbi:hypothetical protein KIL84_014318 [Mauremys mutica]|uniref:Cytochrome c oxidase assembly protein COX19 n=1 Tax=Mauremys mutica TaxID=74926 RepID=A0A9D4B0N2_9SAUR|nr:hypothetical protein KIL84_014318 [Mauremys mutica]